MSSLRSLQLDKVTYLINSTGDKTRHFLSSKEMREGGTEAGGGLYGGEGHFTNVASLIKPEYLLSLVEVHTLLYPSHVPVEFLAGGDVFEVTEDEGLLGVETECYDILKRRVLLFTHNEPFST